MFARDVLEVRGYSGQHRTVFIKYGIFIFTRSVFSSSLILMTNIPHKVLRFCIGIQIVPVYLKLLKKNVCTDVSTYDVNFGVLEVVVLDAVQQRFLNI